MSDLLTPAPTRPEAPAGLPWHLRKRFLLPVLAVLVVGAVCSAVLLAGAVYTYVRVQLALSELSADLQESGLFGGAALGSAGAPTGAMTDDSESAVSGEVGESGPVTYELTGDLQGVEVTWTHMSTGATMTRQATALEWPLTFQVDGSWQAIGLEAHRTGKGSGEVTCSVSGGSQVLVNDVDSGRDASVACYL